MASRRTVNKGKDVAPGPDRHTTGSHSAASNNPSYKPRSGTAMESSRAAPENTPPNINRLSPDHFNASRNTPLAHKQGSGRSSVPSVPNSGSARLRVSAAATSVPIDRLIPEAFDNDRDGSSSPLGELFDEENEGHPENSIIEEHGTPTTSGGLVQRQSHVESSGRHPSAKRSHTAMMGEEEYIVHVGRPIGNLGV